MEWEVPYSADARRFFELEEEAYLHSENGWRKGESVHYDAGGMVYDFSMYQKKHKAGSFIERLDRESKQPRLTRTEIGLGGISVATFDKYMWQYEDQGDGAMKECKILERLPNGFPSTMYFKYKFKGMALRDAVVQIEKVPVPDGRTLYIITSTDHPDYPVSPLTDKVIRMDLWKAFAAE